MSSNDNESMDTSSVEFTLEDTYDQLKEVKNQKEQEIKNLINVVNNNQVQTLGPDVTPEQIKQKRLKYIQSMQKFVAQMQPKDLPIPNTNDFYANALKELEEEVSRMEALGKITDEEINEISTDITDMEKKLAAFKEMKEALAAEESKTNTNYEAEMVIAKEIFKEVKEDLANTVSILFPDNTGFQDLLCNLTRAFSKGGDDVYIDVQPAQIDFINFLEDADIVQFHPHDKSLIKLVEF